MEAKLFFVSLWCGLYAFALRAAVKRNLLSKKPAIGVFFSGLFWATAFFLGSLLLSSYTDHPEKVSKMTLNLSLLGAVFGCAMALIKRRQAEKIESMTREYLEWADTGFSAILLASLVMYFVLQAFKIPSGSMRMTFVEGDHLFVNKFIYGLRVPLSGKKILPLRDIRQKDIVIFRFPSNDPKNLHYGKDFIKRVIALEGQTVQIVDKKMLVDGVELDEPYKQHVDSHIYKSAHGDSQTFQMLWERGINQGDVARDNFGPVVVPEGTVFVVGDNRDQSYDGRFWGPLPVAEIKGRAWVIYWPPKRMRVTR